jgi:hypothetical protein
VSTLTDAQVALLAEAGVLIGRHAMVLTELEQETLADVASRFGRFRRNAVVTPREWAVFGQAVAVMRAADRRDLVLSSRERARAIAEARGEL